MKIQQKKKQLMFIDTIILEKNTFIILNLSLLITLSITNLKTQLRLRLAET